MDVGEVQPLPYQRELEFHPRISPAGRAFRPVRAAVRGVDIPVHRVKHCVLAGNVKGMHTLLQVLRHARPPGEPARCLFIFLQRGQPPFEGTDCLLQDPLGRLHGESAKKVRISIRAHDGIQRPV